MVRHLRIAAAALTLLLVAAASAQARSGGSSRAGCTGSTTSAINQYCEVVPTGSGASGAGPITPELATTLPRRTALRLFTQPQRAQLLFLPAPQRRPPTAAVSAPSAAVGSTSIWLALALVLAAIALLMGGVEVARRRVARPT